MCARRSNNDAICVDLIAMKRDDAISISQPKRLVSFFKVANKSEKFAKC